jgi:hypothetical protein
MDFLGLVAYKELFTVDLELLLEHVLVLLLQLVLLVLQDDCLFANFVLNFTESLLFKFDLLVLMVQVFLNLIELHLMGESTVVQLRKDVQRLSIINVDALYSHGTCAHLVKASLLNYLCGAYLIIWLPYLIINLRRLMQ